MEQSSVDDFIGTVMVNWYTRVALWVPPGQPADARCAICRDSVLGETIDVTVWPHDLMHSLAVSLGLAVNLVERSLTEDALEFATRRGPAAHGTAHLLVASSLSDCTDEIIDVLASCVTYRLEDPEFLAAEGEMLERA
jgi:hypothetical protein